MDRPISAGPSSTNRVIVDLTEASTKDDNIRPHSVDTFSPPPDFLVDLGTPDQDQENIPPTSAQQPSYQDKGKTVKKNQTRSSRSSSADDSGEDGLRTRSKDSIPAYEMNMFNAVVNTFSVLTLNIGILDNHLNKINQLKEIWRNMAIKTRHIEEDGEPLTPSPQVVAVVCQYMQDWIYDTKST